MLINFGYKTSGYGSDPGIVVLERNTWIRLCSTAGSLTSSVESETTEQNFSNDLKSLLPPHTGLIWSINLKNLSSNNLKSFAYFSQTFY